MKNNLMTWAARTIARGCDGTRRVQHQTLRPGRIGLIAPMSGPWARQGEVMKRLPTWRSAINQQAESSRWAEPS
jgi:hypothetical protein